MIFWFWITDFGAVEDGVTACGKAFAAAMDACNAAGGGTVAVPPGVFLTAPIRLVSNLTLHLEAGACVRFTDDINDYPIVETRWGGTELFVNSPQLYGRDLHNVTVSGKGTFDGNPEAWWAHFRQVLKDSPKAPVTDREQELQERNRGRFEHTDCGGPGLEAMQLRPPLIQLNNCSNVRLDGVTAANPPFWNTHLVYCRNVTVHDVTFRNPPTAPNGDGLDLDSCGATDENRAFLSDPGPRPVEASTPAIGNVRISNIIARGRMAAAGVFIGLPESPIRDVSLDQVDIVVDPAEKPFLPAMAFHLSPLTGGGIVGRHLQHFRMRNSRLHVATGPPFSFSDSIDVRLENSDVTPGNPGASRPLGH